MSNRQGQRFASIGRQINRQIKKLNKQTRPIRKLSKRATKRLINAIIRWQIKWQRAAQGGFVLPTVTMVMLVVVLLTVAISLRSFDRADMARNVRVNQAVLSAAAPALDRAKAKIQYLLEEDPTRPLSTPKDDELYQRMTRRPPEASEDRYTFADEDRLSISYDWDGTAGITVYDPSDPTAAGNTGVLEESEQIETAWRFPVDTDNNNKYDTYSIYAILFRSPPRSGSGFARTRNPLDARTPPMQALGAGISQECEQALGTSAGLVGASGWYKSGSNLKKGFFVYTANVPITNSAATTRTDDEDFKGTRAYSALEYQQDWSRIPLVNNAVVYENDLEISPGPDFTLNGRIFTNSNFIVTYRNNDGSVTLRQVSSKNSCFYEEENSKIIVGGNVVQGWSGGDDTAKNIAVDLIQGVGGSASDPITRNISQTGPNQSVPSTDDALSVLYNNNEYAQRLGKLVDAQIASGNADPEAVSDAVTDRMAEEGSTGDTVREGELRRQELEIYFKNRMRKPTAVDLADSAASVAGASSITGTGDALRPAINAWILPTAGTAAAATNGSGTGYTGLTLELDKLEAKNPATREENVETYLGDRILAGNNLPALRWSSSASDFLGKEAQLVDGTTTWDDSTVRRTRTSRVESIADTGSTARFGFWEQMAALKPEAALDGIGGLRLVTGAGVYDRASSFLPPPLVDDPRSDGLEAQDTYDDPTTGTATVDGTTNKITSRTLEEKYPIVWPDTMPMSPIVDSEVYDNATGSWIPYVDGKGDLQMRATVVYHYADNAYDPANNVTVQTPIACISSYYDPSTEDTARNTNAGGITYNADANGKSNNGVVYGPPTYAAPGQSTISTAAATLGLLGGGSPTDLENQANLVFPDGRWVNEPLRDALLKAPADRNLANQSAIDAAACAFGILGTTGFTLGTAPTYIPDGAIEEVAFLNAREIKAIDTDDPTTNVDETFSLSSPLESDPIFGETGTEQQANLTGNYDLALEERMPLEIRATKIDLELLRKATLTQNIATGPKTDTGNEYMLPFSGIIYATRDDALLDRSDRTPNSTNTGIDENTSELISRADSLLDPTRRPNGILLVDGDKLARGSDDPTYDTVEKVVQEKGLILASNLPVYIQASPDDDASPTEYGFNLHTQEEFTDNDMSFYDRTNLNTKFACRKGDPRISGCSMEGDLWRQATVLADSLTILSNSFNFGYRDYGDFNLRNNMGGTIIKGYDLNGNGFIQAADTANEVTLNRDLNWDGDRIDAAVPETEIFIGTQAGGPVIQGYDANGNGTIAAADTVDEADFGMDLNGDTDATDTGVAETDIVLTAKTARLLNGFFSNNYVTSKEYTDGAYTNQNGTTGPPGTYPDKTMDSYFNNFVTPIQRRVRFPEYVMEMCRKPLVEYCGPDDWVVGTSTSPSLKASEIPSGTAATALLSRTTSFQGRTAESHLFPRRLAFLRYTSGDTNKLVLDSNDNPIPIGVNASGNVAYYAYDSNLSGIPNVAGGNSATAGVPRVRPKTLWFKMTADTTNADPTDTTEWNYGNGTSNRLYYQKGLTDTGTSGSYKIGTVEQPLLAAVLQLNEPERSPGANENSLPLSGSRRVTYERLWWIQRALNSATVNVVVGARDVPSRRIRDGVGDFNGGLQNLPRFLEIWEVKNNLRDVNIAGGFIELERSAYATAPYQHILDDTPPGSIFGYNNNRYRTDVLEGRTPYFNPPERDWGFDVGILSQSPDLFAQQFTIPASDSTPDEFYRELNRDDDWIKGLLCATPVEAADPEHTPSGTDCADYQ